MSPLLFNIGQQKSPNRGFTYSECIHHPVTEYILAKASRQLKRYGKRTVLGTKFAIFIYSAAINRKSLA